MWLVCRLDNLFQNHPENLLPGWVGMAEKLNFIPPPAGILMGGGYLWGGPLPLLHVRSCWGDFYFNEPVLQESIWWNKTKDDFQKFFTLERHFFMSAQLVQSWFLIPWVTFQSHRALFWMERIRKQLQEIFLCIMPPKIDFYFLLIQWWERLTAV